MAQRTNLNVSLTPELCGFVAGEVRSGRFRSASEVVRAGLRGLRQVPSSGAGLADEGHVAPGVSPAEHRYRAIMESAVEYAIIAFGSDRRIVEWNAGAEAIMGWTAAEMLGHDGAMLFTPEDRAAGVPATEMHRASEEGRAVNERWHMRADGGRFWGSGLVMPIRDGGGALVGHLKIMQDRTDAHRLNRSVEESGAQLRALFEAVPVGILVSEAPSGRIVGSNPRIAELFGAHWPRSGAVSDYGAWECFHPDGRRVLPHEHPMARALKGEERPILEVLRRSDDDGRHWTRITGAAIRAVDGRITGAVVTVEDIDPAKRAQAVLRQDNDTLRDEAVDAAASLKDSRRELVGAEARREMAEGQVRQLQKLEAVGQLTGGIAHDFNNMLAVVIGGLGLAQRRLARGDAEVSRFIEAAMDGAKRAATLTQRLLAFSRQQALAPVSLDMNAMVRGMEELLRRTLGEAAELEMVLAGRLWRTHVDPSQLENALLNGVLDAGVDLLGKPYSVEQQAAKMRDMLDR